MGKKGGKAPVQQTQQRNVPEWVENEGKALYNKAKATAQEPNKGAAERIYQGQRVAPMTGMQQQAMQQAQQNNGKYIPQMNEVSAKQQEQYNRGAQQVGSGANPQRITSEYNPYRVKEERFTGTGPNDLFTAYYNKMYHPMAAELNAEAQRGMTQQRQQSAFGGKALGSQRALEQGQLESGRLKQLQSLGANVFDKAMNTYQTEAQRAQSGQIAQAAIGAQDLDRMMQAQMSQAGINEQDLARKLQADLANQTADQNDKSLNLKNIEGMMSNIGQKYNMDMKDVAALFGFDNGERGCSLV